MAQYNKLLLTELWIVVDGEVKDLKVGQIFLFLL